MSQISAICLSDLHFGYWGSVLTAADGRKADIHKVSPVLESLVDCIEAILSGHDGKDLPKLVLAGDVLELSLAYTNQAASVFAQFLQLVYRDRDLPLDRRIVYLPGNHDHHLWELAREDQYTQYLREPGTNLPLTEVPWHVSHLFPWREELDVPDRSFGNPFLDAVAKKIPDLPGPERVDFRTMYPNFGILGSDGSRCTVIHHGHFTESIYHLMTELQRIVFPERLAPSKIRELEAQNFAWIDFLWGTLGRSGSVGKDVGLIYEMLHTRAGRCQLVHKLAWNIPAHFKRPWWLRPLEIPILYIVLGWLLSRFSAMERTTRGEDLSKDSWKRLDTYVGRYVEEQLQRELGNSLPEHVSFVFGHTHKPFEDVHYVAKAERSVQIYNTGGWVVDSVEADSRKGGAIVVVDEEGYAASVRMYNEAKDPGDYAVKVAQADGGGGNPLYESLCALVKPDRPPWSAFSGEVAKAVEDRHRILREVTAG